METVKHSFLSNLFGRNTYDGIKKYAIKIVPIGTIVLILLFVLTRFFYWSFLSYILSLVTGTSIFFIGYAVCVLTLLDFEIEDEKEEKYYWDEPKKSSMSMAYKKTIVWGITLLMIGVASVYYSNKYRKHYSFECDKWYVDLGKGIYHLYDYNDDCDMIEEDTDLRTMTGHEILESTNCKFCPSCEEWIEEAESNYDPTI